MFVVQDQSDKRYLVEEPDEKDWTIRIEVSKYPFHAHDFETFAAADKCARELGDPWLALEMEKAK